MDHTKNELARYAAVLRFEDLPAEVVHEARRHVVDTMGCAVGGSMSPPGRIAREIAGEYSGLRQAHVLGLGRTTTPELAAFANAVMGRYLDWNDSFGATNISAGHPSDMIPGVFAVAEAFHASGRKAILGVVAAYQANSSVLIPLKRIGWDQGIQVGIGVAVGAGVVLGLTEAQIGNAISMALVPNIPLRVSRSGELSHWKGCAGAIASRNAVFAVLLAAKGMIGPELPFEGRHGLFDQVYGPFELDLDPATAGWGIVKSNLKIYPAEGGAQKLLATLFDVARGLPEEEIEAVEARTNWALWFDSGYEPEKWDPKTPETADHSLPYMMAMALREGTLTPASYRIEKVREPSLRPLMNKIRIVENPEFTAANPDMHGESEIEITTRSGKRLTARSGIWKKITDAEVEAKFRSLAEPLSSPEQCDRVLAEAWAIDEAADVGSVLETWAGMIGAV